MLVFLRAEDGWSGFKVPIGKDQAFMFTMTQAKGERNVQVYSTLKKRGSGGETNTLVLAGRGTILGFKVISNSLCVEATEECFSRVKFTLTHKHDKDCGAFSLRLHFDYLS